MPTVQREPAQLLEALSYKAPFLAQKLVKEQIVASAREAEELFTELLRYLVLGRMYPHKYWYMASRLVDEAWHQFVLFTRQYMAFCQRYFGQYLHHQPGMSPDVPELTVSASFADFCEHYAQHFGAPPPELWQDTHWIALSRRIIVNESLCPVIIDRDDLTGMIAVSSHRGPVVAVSAIAQEAMEFIWRTKAFFVRELPGGLTDDEKLGLIEVLVAREAVYLAT
jgi:hypothetical protein